MAIDNERLKFALMGLGGGLSGQDFIGAYERRKQNAAELEFEKRRLYQDYVDTERDAGLEPLPFEIWDYEDDDIEEVDDVAEAPKAISEEPGGLKAKAQVALGNKLAQVSASNPEAPDSFNYGAMTGSALKGGINAAGKGLPIAVLNALQGTSNFARGALGLKPPSVEKPSPADMFRKFLSTYQVPGSRKPTNGYGIK